MSNPSSAEWFVPAFIAAFVSLVATAVTSQLTKEKNTREHLREVMKVRQQIVEAAGEKLEFKKAKLMLDYVLRPIDATDSHEDFSTSVKKELYSDAATETKTQQQRQELLTVVPPASGTLQELIAQLSGPERLAASNALLATENKNEVVDALVDATDRDHGKFDYRVKLYAVFTLARMPGKWPGTQQQRDKIAALSAKYGQDPTFRDRLGEALGNWRKR